jgi:lipoprotein-releasing system ATP-binding protein
MLKALNIQKSFGSLQVLKGIDLEVKKGEVISIVGASGAGKSTFLHIAGTLDKPDAGEIYLNNQNLVNIKGNQLARFRNQHIGFIFQFHNLLPEFSAYENVCIPGYLGKRPQTEVEDYARNLLGLLGLTERMHHKPGEMSGGEQQRTAVARSLINNPDILFADEPSGNLDSRNAEELHKLFFKLRDELGQTTVIITHNEELADMADRKLEMKDGRIL